MANNARNLGGDAPSFYTTPSNINSGTLSGAPLTANVALPNAIHNFSHFNIFYSGAHASLVSGTSDVQIDPGGVRHLAIDDDELRGRNGAGGAGGLFLNNQDGNVFIGNAGTSPVGIGTSSPQRCSHVFGGSAGTVTSNFGSIVT